MLLVTLRFATRYQLWYNLCISQTDLCKHRLWILRNPFTFISVLVYFGYAGCPFDHCIKVKILFTSKVSSSKCFSFHRTVFTRTSVKHHILFLVSVYDIEHGVIIYHSSWIMLLLFPLFDEYAAESLEFGNSVYWIRFDEEFSKKVIAFFIFYPPDLSGIKFQFFIRLVIAIWHYFIFSEIQIL